MSATAPLSAEKRTSRVPEPSAPISSHETPPQARLLRVLVVFILVFVVELFKLLEHGARQGLAKQIAFRAHPETEHVVALDVRDGERLPAGFQHDDIAGF